MAATPDTDDRRALAMVCNSLTPYRINLHKILAAAIPELRLETFVTHAPAEFDWRQDVPAEIHAQFFARGKEAAHGGPLVAPWTDWKKGADLIRAARAADAAAVVFTGFAYSGQMRLMASLFRQGTPVFLRNDSNVHDVGSRSWPRRKIKEAFFRYVRRRAAGFMPMGTYGKAYFAHFGVPESMMYLAPYTPDYDWFAESSPVDVTAFGAAHRLDRCGRWLMFSGRLNPVKRVDLVIDAFAAIAAQRPEWGLLIVGAGPLEHELRSRLPEHLQDRVEWTGFLEVDQLRCAYHSADVLLLPSQKEPWGVVVQEAMAAGLPVVASHVVGAARDLVVDGASGRFFTRGSLDEFVAAILDVTAAAKIEGYRRGAKESLAAWRRRVDVVAEFRRALRDVGALPS